MLTRPFSICASLSPEALAGYDHHIVRRLSAMRGQYADRRAYAAMLAHNPVLYEVFEVQRPASAGELRFGLSIVHPGKVGDEYFMTKGHFHRMLQAAELYYCLKGKGVMVMETPEGAWAVQDLKPGSAVYVPPRWAHRTVNTARQDLVFWFVYPGDAGHDYGTIARQGFRKLVVERQRKPQIIDNPRWRLDRRKVVI